MSQPHRSQPAVSELTIAVLPTIKVPLVNKIYKDYYPSGKAKKDEHIVTASSQGSIVAMVRFRHIEQYRLLTGMLVIPEKREHGIGHQLLDYCQSNELNNNDFCFAYTHLEKFYKQHNFYAIEPAHLPNSLKNLFERYVNSGRSLIPMQFQVDI
ncbi:GNAT family N-acetyltransferase [uncultured Vibrio sp.]|uniref:GNAT family N-acetyltransferase n=1 Tax=uncultured Vibrio sp. TaxID=114054 RepID=UPI00091792E7|nr:GNAT family N-acetyltransferase [uncultured Vibrio sp.]OIQ25332.1 MAG: GNAT family N-acetyltransferase [Vibrio sp. MedPE-SWchi]